MSPFSGFNGKIRRIKPLNQFRINYHLIPSWNTARSGCQWRRTPRGY